MTDLRTVQIPRLAPGPVTGESLQPYLELLVREVLAKADIRAATGVGITISADGNVVATLDTATAISAAITTHNADVSANTPAFNVHRGETDPHPDLIDDLTAATAVAAADLVIVSQSGTNKQGTVAQVTDAVFGERWTDLVIEGTGINPIGAAADPARSAVTGLLEFSGTADNVITGCWQMPHGWKAGSLVRPHMHIRFTTSSVTNSRWKFEYDVADVDGTFANVYGTFTTLDTVTAANPQSTTKAAIVSFGDLSMTGKKGSSLIHFKISRLAASDAADTYTGLCILYSMDLHYQVASAGSPAEVPT
jgi:hypothetical protein